MTELSLIAYSPGDDSVGIFDETYTIENIALEDQEHREEVRKAFTDAFLVLGCDPVRIYFSDEF